MAGADTGSGQFHKHDGITRRSMLAASGLGLCGLSLPQYLAARDRAPSFANLEQDAGQASRPEAGGTADPLHASFGRAKACIMLFMWGGPAHQDTWDLKPDAPAEVRGEFRPIATAVPGITIGEHFPELALRTDRLCQIRSMTHNNADHTISTHYLLTGMPPPAVTDIRAQWPALGSVLSRLGRGQGVLPPFISMRPKLENDVPRFVEQSQGQFAGWLGPLYDPMTLDQDPSRDDYRIGELRPRDGLDEARLRDRQLLRRTLSAGPFGVPPPMAAHGANMERALRLLTSAADEKGAFDLEQESPEMRDRYGRNPHGQSVLQARRLIERGVPLVTVFWPNDGIKNVSVYWDTHSRNFIDLKERLMPVADRAFSALLDDLRDRGMLDNTLILWTGEFGRTPRIGQRNSDAGAGPDGRDHWPGCFTSVLAGAGVMPGSIYGRSDRHAAYPASDPVWPVDLFATVYHLLGVAPEQTVEDSSGRPHFVRPGRVITELLA
ncbi:MAG: DUF1501 domain-containing protein [Planctomycetes bacterium]|nr:DUF1501 domain-containing protein [Planctomycetota bacterium]